MGEVYEPMRIVGSYSNTTADIVRSMSEVVRNSDRLVRSGQLPVVVEVELGAFATLDRLQEVGKSLPDAFRRRP